MPITTGKNAAPAMQKKECCSGHGCMCSWGGEFGKRILLTLVGVLLVYVIFFFGTLVRNNLKKFFSIGRADRAERMVMVAGYGKVSGTNDIAVTTIGYSNTDKDVAKAQLDNKKVMDQILNELKALGIADKDMQSDYSIYPDYNYTPQKGQELKGYRVSNQITVKIRDLSKITNVLNLAGKYGATEVSGLNFTIDDPENLKGQARDKALLDAQTKAAKLAESLGVSLGDVVNYNEYEGASTDYYPMAVKSAEGGGMGGFAPEAVVAGSKDVSMNVSITYEILSK